MGKTLSWCFLEYFFRFLDSWLSAEIHYYFSLQISFHFFYWLNSVSDITNLFIIIFTLFHVIINVRFFKIKLFYWCFEGSSLTRFESIVLFFFCWVVYLLSFNFLGCFVVFFSDLLELFVFIAFIMSILIDISFCFDSTGHSFLWILLDIAKMYFFFFFVQGIKYSFNFIIDLIDIRSLQFINSG